MDYLYVYSRNAGHHQAVWREQVGVGMVVRNVGITCAYTRAMPGTTRRSGVSRWVVGMVISADGITCAYIRAMPGTTRRSGVSRWVLAWLYVLMAPSPISSVSNTFQNNCIDLNFLLSQLQ